MYGLHRLYFHFQKGGGIGSTIEAPLSSGHGESLCSGGLIKTVTVIYVKKLAHHKGASFTRF